MSFTNGKFGPIKKQERSPLNVFDIFFVYEIGLVYPEKPGFRKRQLAFNGIKRSYHFALFFFGMYDDIPAAAFKEQNVVEDNAAQLPLIFVFKIVLVHAHFMVSIHKAFAEKFMVYGLGDVFWHPAPCR